MNKKLKEDLRDLRALASQLPATFTEAKVSRSVFGHQILERDPNYKDDDGNPLNPKKVYSVVIAEKIMVNDARRLKKIYKNHGIVGVKKYVDEVVALNTKKQTVGGLELVSE